MICLADPYSGRWAGGEANGASRCTASAEHQLNQAYPSGYVPVKVRNQLEICMGQIRRPSTGHLTGRVLSDEQPLLTAALRTILTTRLRDIVDLKATFDVCGVDAGRTPAGWDGRRSVRCLRGITSVRSTRLLKDLDGVCAQVP